MLSVRRLAAIDMYGTKGKRLRRRLVLVEFVAVVLVCFFLSALLILKGDSVGLIIIGIWTALLGANYCARRPSGGSHTRRAARLANRSVDSAGLRR